MSHPLVIGSLEPVLTPGPRHLQHTKLEAAGARERFGWAMGTLARRLERHRLHPTDRAIELAVISQAWEALSTFRAATASRAHHEATEKKRRAARASHASRARARA